MSTGNLADGESREKRRDKSQADRSALHSLAAVAPPPTESEPSHRHIRTVRAHTHTPPLPVPLPSSSPLSRPLTPGGMLPDKRMQREGRLGGCVEVPGEGSSPRRRADTPRHTFVPLIFLAAPALNWSHSGPLPWPSADERTYSGRHYPPSFQGCSQ